MKRYGVAVDIGGTFVDSVLYDRETNEVRLAKASTTPAEPQRGVMAALQTLGVDLADSDVFVHGTTLGLNAVLERRGAVTGIITNDGFRDIFEVARGDVPARSMYDFAYEPPPTLVRRRHRIGVRGRLNAKGEEVTPLDIDGVRAAAAELAADGVEAVALCFLHSYRNPAHEARAAELIRREFPSLRLSASSEITREYHEYERTATAVLDAYINPIFSSYIERLERAVADSGFVDTFLLMRSSGGAMTASRAKKAPIHTVMSGPAGGIVGATFIAQTLERDRILTLDYGGTSLDASVIENGQPLVMHEATLEHFPALIPIFDIRCIGAGGGSIAWVEEGLLQVGPRSAGAVPGPVAYGRGGVEPTTTDAALILGYLDPEAFLGGALKLDVELARAAMQEKVAAKLDADVAQASAAVFDVLIARTAGAIREITVERGKDPRDFTMLAFGGAGPMIGPLIAREVENAELIIPNSPAAFSAWGMLMSDLVAEAAKTEIQMLTTERFAALKEDFAELTTRVRDELSMQAVAAKDQIIEHVLECRYFGQEHAIETTIRPGETAEDIRVRFDALHEERYGHAMADPVQVVTLRARGRGLLTKSTLPKRAPSDKPVASALTDERLAYCFARRAMTPFSVYQRDKLAPGHAFDGPAIVEEGTSTTIIHSDQSLSVDAYGQLVVRRRHP